MRRRHFLLTAATAFVPMPKLPSPLMLPGAALLESWLECGANYEAGGYHMVPAAKMLSDLRYYFAIDNPSK